jgi:hypothetical protein
MLPRIALPLVLLFTSLGFALPDAARDPLPAAVAAAFDGITLDELHRHVSRLADDAMGGRGLGQTGNRDAERYLADALHAAGVAPASNGYLHPFELYAPTLGHDASLRVDGLPEGVAELGLSPDFVPLPPSADREVTGGLLFAGHGISVPGAHDDYRRRDARGTIVLAFEGAPAAIARLPGRSDADKAAFASLAHKVDAARRHGARGLLVIRHDMGEPRSTWPPRAISRPGGYRLYEDIREGGLVVAAISDQAASPLREALARGAALTATVRPGVVAEPLTVHNVLGTVEGRGPADGVVVIGAHFDHDGTDEAGRIIPPSCPSSLCAAPSSCR